MFVKFYNVWGYSIIIESFGHKYNFVNTTTVAKFQVNGNFTVLK